MSKSLKILLFIDWFLPGTASGGPLRSWANLIAHLEDDFEFYIITRNTDFGSNTPYSDITPNTWTPLNSTTQVYYIAPEALNIKHLKQLIDTTNFDVACVNGIYSRYFSILPVWLLKSTNKPVMVSARGMLNPQAFSVKGTRKHLFLILAKLFGLYNGVVIHATNPDEAAHIKQKIGTKATVRIAPNLPRPMPPSIPKTATLHQPVRFVNVARIAKEKGTLIMLKALTALKQPLQLDLYGPIYDNVYWQQCQEAIVGLPAHIKVNYRGFVASEEIPETLLNYDFFVLLSEGENFGHAIIEALSAGLPVVISDKTPWKGLESKSVGWDVVLQDQDAILKSFNAALTMSDANYAKWSKASFDYAKAFVDDPKVLEMNRSLFKWH